MGAFDLIRELRGAGVSIRADGAMLDIFPADALTDEIIEALKRHKPEILSLLHDEVQEWKPDKCNRCAHLSRFHNGGACRVDNGLPKLFGLLYAQPEDMGATCTSWKPDVWEIVCPTEWLH